MPFDTTVHSSRWVLCLCINKTDYLLLFNSNSCCYVRKPLRSWRRSRNAKPLKGGVSLKRGAVNPRTLTTQTKVITYYFCTSMCYTVSYLITKLNHTQFIFIKTIQWRNTYLIYLYTLQFTAYFKPQYLCCCVCHIIDTLRTVCRDYHTRIGNLEDEKFDLEYIVKRKDMEVVRLAATELLPFGLNLQNFFFNFVVVSNWLLLYISV